MASVPAVLTSEWTKIRTVSSTTWTLISAFVVTVAMGAALCAVMNSQFDQLAPEERATFDPTYISFSGMILGQLAMVVFGVLVVGTEYSSGMIRTSLAAVPQRATFLLGKMLVAGVLALVVGLATSFATFFLGQALLGDHRTDIGADNVLRAVVGGGLYMGLIAIFSMGVAAMLRSSMLSLGILMPFFFLVSQILTAVPGAKTVARYFPDQAGSKIMQVVPDALNSDPAPYGPWAGLLIMVAWVAASVIGGLLVLKKRDASRGTRPVNDLAGTVSAWISSSLIRGAYGRTACAPTTDKSMGLEHDRGSRPDQALWREDGRVQPFLPGAARGRHRIPRSQRVGQVDDHAHDSRP